MSDPYDIAIIGAGAAGLAAGIFAAEAASASGLLHPQIVLLDGAKTIGAKILVSGGGRCNVTHDRIVPEDFAGPRTIVRNVLAAFDEKATVRWMQSLGVELKREDTGKLFPVTDSARTVVAALLDRLQSLGVEIRAGCRVSEVFCEPAQAMPAAETTATKAPTSRAGFEGELKSSATRTSSDCPLFRIVHSQGALLARRIIFATGGRSLPRTGSDGAGWAMVRKLGHTVTATYPALVPLVLEHGMFHADVSGLSHPAELSTFVLGKRIDCRTGSLLWTHFGVSGPVVMDASRYWVMAHAQGQAVELRCSLAPGESFEKVEAWLIQLAKARPKLSTVKAVAEKMPERLAEAMLRYKGVDPSTVIGQLTREQGRMIVHALTALPLPVAHDRGWNYAEVTAGGVPLEEIDFRTMASRKAPGLFLAGEILDCDGRIGGFNFQWAWATGYLAGRGAVKSLSEAGPGHQA